MSPVNPTIHPFSSWVCSSMNFFLAAFAFTDQSESESVGRNRTTSTSRGPRRRTSG